jgi:hypothetical protein
MKKIFIPLLFLLSMPVFSQTGIGWVPYRFKMNVRDSSYFYKDARFNGTVRVAEGNIKLGAVTITANGTEINILDGLLSSTAELNYLVGVTSNVQTQLTSKANTSALSSYAPLANPNFTTAVRLASDSILPKARLQKIINDSIMARIASAGNLGDYAWLKTDTIDGQPKNLATQTDLSNIVGGGTTSNYGYLAFRVDSGPAETLISGDSIITGGSFVDKDLVVYRNGLRQYPKDKSYYVANTIEHDSATLIFHPTFVSNDRIIIETYDPISRTDLYLTGTNPQLLDSLRAYWSMDETEGNNVSDSHTGNFDGTTNATVGNGMVHGKSRSFDKASSQYVSLGPDVGDVGISDWGYSAWIYVPTLTSGYKGILGNWVGYGAENYPYYYLRVDAGNMLIAVANFTGTNIEISSNSAISAYNLTHIVVTYDRSGSMTMYVNDVAQTDTKSIAAGVSVPMNNSGNFNIGNIGQQYSDSYWSGIIDEVALYRGRVLSASDVHDLFRNGLGTYYPFNLE